MFETRPVIPSVDFVFTALFFLLKPHPALEPYLVCAWVTRGDVQQIKLTLIDIRIQEPNHFLFWV